MNNLVNPWLYYDALQCFTNSIFGNVRSILINEEPWFIGADVARCLGYSRERDAIADHVDEEDKYFLRSGEIPRLNLELGGKNNYGAYIINESGLYSLIFSSKMPIAKEFKHWVTSEVLPTIRRIGYSRSMELLQNELQRKEQEITKLNIILQGCDTWSLSTFNKNINI